MIWLRPASLMVSVGDMKYLKARSRLSLSKHSVLSSGSFTVLHIRSAMLRAALCRSSWSDSLHRYLSTGGVRTPVAKGNGSEGQPGGAASPPENHKKKEKKGVARGDGLLATVAVATGPLWHLRERAGGVAAATGKSKGRRLTESRMCGTG